MLDQKVREWREKIKIALADKDLSEGPYEARITIGDQAMKIQGCPVLREALLGINDEVVEAFRNRMPSQAWPICLVFECSRDNDITLSKFSVSGILLNTYSSRKLISCETASWSRHLRTLTGLDCVADDFDLLSKMCPPSNQPVRAWSMAHTIMGTPHVTYDGFHARTEAEVLLKVEWERYGREGLDEIIDHGGLRERRNDEKLFFVAQDLHDFNLDPEGRFLDKIDASSDIAKHLESLNDTSRDLEP